MHVVILAFAGWSLPTIEASIAEAEKVTVVTYAEEVIQHQPPFWTSIEKLCRTRGINVQLDNWPPEYLWREHLNGDVLISSNWRHLIPRNLWASFPLGAFNVHRSLLPKYRGASPINWAIANGETQTGVTVHMISDELDAGDIVAQEPMEIGPADTATSVYVRSTDVVHRLVRCTLQNLRVGTLVRSPQENLPFRTCPARTGSELQICWEWPRKRVIDHVRAQSPPFPSSYTHACGRVVLIEEVVSHDIDVDGVPGLVVETSLNGSATVLCGPMGSGRHRGLCISNIRVEGTASSAILSEILRVGTILNEDEARYGNYECHRARMSTTS